MLSPQEQGWLLSTYEAATESEHVFPAMAACEAALESSWGASKLCLRASGLAPFDSVVFVSPGETAEDISPTRFEIATPEYHVYAANRQRCKSSNTPEMHERGNSCQHVWRL
jgi:hypothetical protein